ncbi:hypothetical protein C8Q80DRAFT_1123386 [Daedaleopsis nitida]|nr:hypothetical protein C8Q80DRAFT_1123386 [Daedaleopsis nitida]
MSDARQIHKILRCPSVGPQVLKCVQLVAHKPVPVPTSPFFQGEGNGQGRTQHRTRTQARCTWTAHTAGMLGRTSVPATRPKGPGLGWLKRPRAPKGPYVQRLCMFSQQHWLEHVVQLYCVALSPSRHTAMWTILNWMDKVPVKKAHHLQLSKGEKHLADKWWPLKRAPPSGVQGSGACQDTCRSAPHSVMAHQCVDNDGKPDLLVLIGYVLVQHFAGVADVRQLNKHIAVIDTPTKVFHTSGQYYRHLLSKYGKTPALTFTIRTYTSIVPPTKEQIVTHLSGCGIDMFKAKYCFAAWADHWMRSRLIDNLSTSLASTTTVTEPTARQDDTVAPVVGVPAPSFSIASNTRPKPQTNTMAIDLAVKLPNNNGGPVKSKGHARKKARPSAAGTGTRAKSPLPTEQTSKVPDVERRSKRRTKGRKGSKRLHDAKIDTEFADGSDPDLTSICASKNQALLRYLGQHCEYEDSSDDDNNDHDDWHDPLQNCAADGDHEEPEREGSCNDNLSNDEDGDVPLKQAAARAEDLEPEHNDPDSGNDDDAAHSAADITDAHHVGSNCDEGARFPSIDSPEGQGVQNYRCAKLCTLRTDQDIPHYHHTSDSDDNFEAERSSKPRNKTLTDPSAGQDQIQGNDNLANTSTGNLQYLRPLVGKLCSSIYKAVHERRRATLYAKDFIPNLPQTAQALKPGIFVRPVTLEQDFSACVCGNVVALLRLWLSFPNNTEMLAGYFVLHLMCAFKNSDVLLLDGVWPTYRAVKASILGQKIKATAICAEMLPPFANALQALPLTETKSQEAYTLHVLTETINCCLPGVKLWTKSLVSAINATDLLSNAPVPEPLNPTSNNVALVRKSVPIPSPSSSLRPSDERGLKVLTNFVLHLLPVGFGENISHPTPLQLCAQKQPDHYLPFCELAPCRQQVTGKSGPYHSLLRSKPGAFASWCIFRTLLFDSDVIHNHTAGFFPNRQAWEAFLREQHYNANDMQSVNHFFNISCYGTMQSQCRQGPKYAPKYFDAEAKWQKLLGEHGDNGGQNPLIAADVSYTGVVERPTVSDMGFAIHRIKKGTYNGLKALNLLSGKNKHTVQEVEDAFGHVYAHLQAHIPQEYHSRIVLDGIMAGHPLCRYIRTKNIEWQ